MREGFKNFLKRDGLNFLLGTGMMAVVGAAMYSTWKEDQQKDAFLEKIAQADVTAKLCPSDKPVTSLTHTLVPIMGIEDRMLQKRGADMLRHATDDGIRFAFCPLAEGTTSFEAGPGTAAGAFPVLKINDAATAQEQQAAILQFLKEYQTGRVSTRYNAIVKADAGLTRVMSGRLPQELDPHDYKWGGESLVKISIPSR